MLPVIPNPGQIFCIGLNYGEHVRETGREITEVPTIFLRLPESQVAHGQDILRPAESHRLDYEAEIAIVIGKGGLFDASQAAFRDLGGVYLAVIGGAAALETTWIEQIEAVDLDDLNPESLWKFKIKNFGPLLVAMDSHGGNLYTKVNDAARDRRASVLAALGVKA